MAIPSNFSATNTADNITARWYIEIEGLRYRYSNWTPSWNPTDASTNRTMAAYMTDLVRIQGQKAEPLNGTCVPHEFDIELLDVGDNLTDVFSIDRDSNQAEVTATIASTATTINVDDSSVFSLPCEIFIDRETMWGSTAPTSATLTVQ